jgi:hypothetical protein
MLHTVVLSRVQKASVNDSFNNMVMHCPLLWAICPCFDRYQYRRRRLRHYRRRRHCHCHCHRRRVACWCCRCDCQCSLPDQI